MDVCLTCRSRPRTTWAQWLADGLLRVIYVRNKCGKWVQGSCNSYESIEITAVVWSYQWQGEWQGQWQGQGEWPVVHYFFAMERKCLSLWFLRLRSVQPRPTFRGADTRLWPSRLREALEISHSWPAPRIEELCICRSATQSPTWSRWMSSFIRFQLCSHLIHQSVGCDAERGEGLFIVYLHFFFDTYKNAIISWEMGRANIFRVCVWWLWCLVA